MKNYRISIISIFCLLLACRTTPPALEPTYIHIDSFGVISPGRTGISTTHEITAVWVYYNDHPVGSFDLPATIPIIATGTGQLKLAAGVKINGRNDLIDIYPFYQPDTSTLYARPGSIVNYTPRTRYYYSAKITTISNFDGVTNFALTGGKIPFGITNADSQLFQGSGTGILSFVNPGDSSVDSTTQSFVLPSGDSYIEFDYNTTVPFYVGMSANLSTLYSSGVTPISGIKPTNGKWQKFYMLTSDFALWKQGTSYNFYFGAALPPGQANGRVLVDNIQLVRF